MLKLERGLLARCDSLSVGDKLREWDLQRRCELGEIAVARVPQTALDISDVGPVHSCEVGQSLLRETVNFCASSSYRFAKSF